MERFHSIAILVLLLVTAPAGAQTSVNDARQGLAAGDFATVESIIGGLSETALETRDFSELRDFYGALFVTANSDRFAQQGAWLAAYPDSPFAAAALAWTHFHRADLYRGTQFVGRTSREAMAAHREELFLSKDMVRRALSEDPNFVPALDLSIVLAQYLGGQAMVPAIVDHALDVAPDRHTLTLGLAALSPMWGGGFGEQLSLCKDAIDRLAEFDEEACLIYITFGSRHGGELRQRALAALEQSDDDFLDFARANAYLNEWREKPEAAEESMRILMATLGPNVSIDHFDSSLRTIAFLFKQPFFEIEAEEALLETLRERLPDDPQNYRILGRILTSMFDLVRPGDGPDQMEEANELWRAMLVHGAYLPETWRAGERLEGYQGNSARPALIGPYKVNQIYYSNHSPAELGSYLVYLRQMHKLASESDPLPPWATLSDLGDGVVLCPMFRAQRLYEHICDYRPDDPGCDGSAWNTEDTMGVKRIMTSADACAWERTAPIEELAFEPVPVSHFLSGDL
ncbi:hypothetical protein [Defluviimonas salinarum]|uniref:DUF4034 domain-containing protein n=1 Tax=Defluviimonas salinarum TaxID=2992147 RepID=A0ABT3J1N6_9RHOB|nr:hypothetical protein [Defluviimonas salinarum]MCW3781551.1 hypothetical protein [Defluviimonas salinarum]